MPGPWEPRGRPVGARVRSCRARVRRSVPWSGRGAAGRRKYPDRGAGRERGRRQSGRSSATREEPVEEDARPRAHPMPYVTKSGSRVAAMSWGRGGDERMGAVPFRPVPSRPVSRERIDYEAKMSGKPRRAARDFPFLPSAVRFPIHLQSAQGAIRPVCKRPLKTSDFRLASANQQGKSKSWPTRIRGLWHRHRKNRTLKHYGFHSRLFRNPAATPNAIPT